MYKLESIHIYPVKSLGGYSVNQCDLLEKGPRGDRRYMLVNENNQHITQRDIPELALFRVTQDVNGFRVTRSSTSIFIPEQLESGPELVCRVWDDEVKALEESSVTHDWFTSQLSRPVKLVFFPENNDRPVDPDYRVGTEQVSLADGYPVLVLGQASLDLLNSKLASPLPMNRFRPNLVFSGGEPHDEDRWKDFTVGSAKLRGVKPCARCAVPTINQDTAEMSEEPTATLAGYRRSGNNILFGENAVVLQPGTVRVGDTIYISTLK